jgi:hypothetical protein
MSEAAAPSIGYTARVRTACARCGKTFDGSLEDGHAWFQKHLAAKHPNVQVTVRTPRPPIHRSGPVSLTRSR